MGRSLAPPPIALAAPKMPSPIASGRMISTAVDFVLMMGENFPTTDREFTLRTLAVNRAGNQYPAAAAAPEIRRRTRACSVEQTTVLTAT